MGAGVSTPRRARKLQWLVAAALALACWLAATADAAALVTDGQAPTVDAAAVTPVVPPAVPADVTAAGTALDAAAAPASSQAQRVAAEVAGAVAGADDGAEPTVGGAIPTVKAAPPPAAEPTAPAAAPRHIRSHSARAAREGARRPARERLRQADARRRADATSATARPAAAPVAVPTIAVDDRPEAFHRVASAGDSASATPEIAPSLDPVFGAVGSSFASGASASLLFGGFAVLLTALSLAGPALRRRLRSRPAMSWPAAFVPLLERPG
jgi:hypothetical protein